MITYEERELDELSDLLLAENSETVADGMSIEGAANSLIDLFQVLRDIADGMSHD